MEEENLQALSLQMILCSFMHLNTFQNYIRIFAKSLQKEESKMAFPNSVRTRSKFLLQTRLF